MLNQSVVSYRALTLASWPAYRFLRKQVRWSGILISLRGGHSGEFWQNVIHWRREWQTTPVFLLWEPHEQYKKVKIYDTRRKPPPPPTTTRADGVQYATREEQTIIAKEAEVEKFYEDLQDLLKLTPKKRCIFHHRKLECKHRKSRDNLEK